MPSESDRVRQELKNAIEGLIKRVTVNATAELIETTPVDTGWARANWIPSIGVSVSNTTGDPENVSSADQQTGIAEVTTRYTLAQGNTFVTNNVPYIVFLNEGSSTQAPSGFVEAAIARAIRSIGRLA